MGGTPRLVMSSAVGQGMTQPWSNWDKQRGEREREREDTGKEIDLQEESMSVAFLSAISNAEDV